MPPSERLRVVVTGQAGLSKERVLERLCNYIYQKDPRWREEQDLQRRSRIEKKLAQFYEAEISLKPMQRFLDLDLLDLQQDMWRKSITDQIERCRADDPQYAFLSLHLTYQWHSLFFSPMTWRIPVATKTSETLEDSLYDIIRRRFKADYCVTLIDDVHAVQARIQRGFYLRLRELLTWRNLETITTDLLAKETILKPRRINARDFQFERSPVVAIRHPPRMLYNLLIEPERPRIYASYPISRTRFNPQYRDEINRFRKTLSEKFAVYDPLTIDERPLQFLLENYIKTNPTAPISGQVFKLAAQDRWHIPADETLCGEEAQDFDNLNADQIEEISVQTPGQKTEINRNIDSRDYRLIDQADCLVIYRPQFLKGQWSGGTEREARYARFKRRRVFVIHDPEEDGKLVPESFDLEFGPDLFAGLGKLSDPANQERVLKNVVSHIENQAHSLTKTRIQTA